MQIRDIFEQKRLWIRDGRAAYPDAARVKKTNARMAPPAPARARSARNEAGTLKRNVVVDDIVHPAGTSGRGPPVWHAAGGRSRA